MKTGTYLATVLVIIIQVMVKGQTSGHQIILSSGTILQDISKGTAPAAGKEMSPLTELAELRRQSEELMKTAQFMRDEAKTLPASEKKELLAEAYRLYKQSEVKQLRMSELSEKIMKAQFNTNVAGFDELLKLSFASDSELSNAMVLFSEAQRAMRLAEEMREEANALPNISQSLGSMNNAEEKEWIAVKKSGEAIQLLKAASAIGAGHQIVAVK